MRRVGYLVSGLLLLMGWSSAGQDSKPGGDAAPNGPSMTSEGVGPQPSIIIEGGSISIEVMGNEWPGNCPEDGGGGMRVCSVQLKKAPFAVETAGFDNDLRRTPVKRWRMTIYSSYMRKGAHGPVTHQGTVIISPSRSSGKNAVDIAFSEGCARGHKQRDGFISWSFFDEQCIAGNDQVHACSVEDMKLDRIVLTGVGKGGAAKTMKCKDPDRFTVTFLSAGKK